ncbi:MAG TPA: Hsp20/alpha crystallin family protein [Ramlibacter sp.]|nr:Hsp20/alpha crystallin family protein [Ramlibacter sp.]
MNPQDNRSGQQGAMGTQQGGGNQPGGQAQQFSSGSGQQGGPSTPASSQQGSQQEAYSPSSGQQGAALSRRGGSGMPSLFGTRGSPFDMLRRLDEDVDRLFQQIWGGGRSLVRGRGAEAPSMWVPQVEVCEEGGKLHVYADLPGLKKEDVKLSLEGDQLVLQGERQSSREEGQQGGSFFHSERSYGSFLRSIPLPEGVDPQTAQANFKDGVLDVTFEAPRRPQQQSRQIEIR